MCAQDNPLTDDLGNVSDSFQDNFFEALKQKGIIFSKQLIVSPFTWGVKSGSAKVFISDQIFHFSLKFIVEKTYCGTLAISNNL